jgi:AraC family transcriptional regulator
MVAIRLEERPAFTVVGKKTRIEGTDSGQFGRFWQQCEEDGTLQQLSAIGTQPGRQTGGMFIGVSCVEADPAIRNFFFLVSAECPEPCQADGLERYTVPAAKWAVFRNCGSMPDALVEAEMTAFLTWLPESRYRHANAPELEVYLPCDGEAGTVCEFWLPVVEAGV